MLRAVLSRLYRYLANASGSLDFARIARTIRTARADRGKRLYRLFLLRLSGNGKDASSAQKGKQNGFYRRFGSGLYRLPGFVRV